MPRSPKRSLLVNLGLESFSELCLAAIQELDMELERQLGRQFLEAVSVALHNTPINVHAV